MGCQAVTVELSVSYPVAVPSAPYAAMVAVMFGLNLQEQPCQRVIAPVQLELGPGQVVFVTGPSGGGKSSLLRAVRRGLAAVSARGVALNDLREPPDRPLVDCFGRLPLPHVMALLARAGLSDARTMLLRPSQLSDGQRWRLRMAQAMERVGAGRERKRLPVLLADEFGASLDRLTARVLARNVRRWARARAICFIAASGQDDLIESLEPDVLIYKGLGDELSVHRRPVEGAAA